MVTTPVSIPVQGGSVIEFDMTDAWAIIDDTKTDLGEQLYDAVVRGRVAYQMDPGSPSDVDGDPLDETAWELETLRSLTGIARSSYEVAPDESVRFVTVDVVDPGLIPTSALLSCWVEARKADEVGGRSMIDDLITDLPAEVVDSLIITELVTDSTTVTLVHVNPAAAPGHGLAVAITRPGDELSFVIDGRSTGAQAEIIVDVVKNIALNTRIKPTEPASGHGRTQEVRP